ncbi:MAG: hypothetical protein KF817_02095 [Phycisphaeraceae bacterium]|nr:hypothetical protein [Phycisphaeraceae bacterium]
MVFLRTSIAGMTVLALVRAGDARTVVFDNGGPNPPTGGVLSDVDAGVRAGDDFVLAPRANTITGIRWWGFHIAAPTVEDRFTIAIHEVVLGLPSGAPVWSLDAGHVRREALAPLEYVYDLAIAPLTLNPGVIYALSIFNHTAPGTDDDWSWYTSGEGSGFLWLGDEPPMTIDRNFAFVLYGPAVPAPGAAVIALGAVMTAGRRRRAGSASPTRTPSSPVGCGRTAPSDRRS